MLTELLGNASSGHSTNKSLLCNSAHVSSPFAATVETCHYLRQSFLGHLSPATSVFLTPPSSGLSSVHPETWALLALFLLPAPGPEWSATPSPSYNSLSLGFWPSQSPSKHVNCPVAFPTPSQAHSSWGYKVLLVLRNRFLFFSPLYQPGRP